MHPQVSARSPLSGADKSIADPLSKPFARPCDEKARGPWGHANIYKVYLTFPLKVMWGGGSGVGGRGRKNGDKGGR